MILKNKKGKDFVGQNGNHNLLSKFKLDLNLNCQDCHFQKEGKKGKVFFFNRNSLSLCLAKVSNSCFSMEPETQAQFALHFLKEHQLLQNFSLPGSDFSGV